MIFLCECLSLLSCTISPVLASLHLSWHFLLPSLPLPVHVSATFFPCYGPVSCPSRQREDFPHPRLPIIVKSLLQFASDFARLMLCDAAYCASNSFSCNNNITHGTCCTCSSRPCTLRLWCSEWCQGRKRWLFDLAVPSGQCLLVNILNTFTFKLEKGSNQPPSDAFWVLVVRRNSYSISPFQEGFHVRTSSLFFLDKKSLFSNACFLHKRQKVLGWAALPFGEAGKAEAQLCKRYPSGKPSNFQGKHIYIYIHVWGTFRCL